MLYIMYWGLLEPLGQALVLPPVTRLAAAGVKLTLVSVEKPHHLADRAAVEKHQALLRAQGIDWLPLRYHQRPTAPATAFDIAHGAARSILKGLRHRPDVVQGRTYVGGLIGSLVSRALRRPFVFYNEGFWPDEQVEGGHWPAGCRPYRITKGWEEALYRNAAGVITLSHQARELVEKYRSARPGTVAVVPSCVDLERFQLPAQPSLPLAPGETCRLLYIGSLGGRYRIGEMARFVRAAHQELAPMHLTIYSHSDKEMIRREMAAHGINDAWWTLDYVPHAQMPGAIARHHAGLFFLAPGVSSRVCSPTKIGEYWACGLPVVTTPQVGDVDDIVQRENVGVAVPEDSDQACRTAAVQLRALLREPDIAARCRAAADTHYNLTRGVDTQIALWRQVRER